MHIRTNFGHLPKTLAVTEASQRRLFYEEQLKQAKEALVSAELTFNRYSRAKVWFSSMPRPKQ